MDKAHSQSWRKYMKFTGIPHIKNVPTSGANTVYVKLDIEPDAVKNNRLPMRVACVFDRSGSMAGDKIENAREAAKLLVRQLSGSDIFCLVAFDNDVQILIEPSSAESKEELQKSIDRLYPGGWTNMGLGLIKAFELMTDKRAIVGVNRILVLSDGHSNQGLLGEALTNRVGIEVEKTGFSVSAFGLGADYDATLLEAITTKGQGSLYHIDTPESTAKFFQEEFGDLLSVSATGTRVQVELPQGVTLKKFYGFEGDKDNVFEIGDLYTDEVRTILMELEVNSDELTEPVEVFLYCNGYNVDGKEFLMRHKINLEINDDEPIVDLEISAFADKIRQATYVKMASEASLNGDWELAQAYMVECEDNVCNWTMYADAGVMSPEEAGLYHRIQYNANAEAQTRGAHTNYSTQSILSYGGATWSSNVLKGRGSSAKGTHRLADMKFDKDDNKDKNV
jgi:Ca-activated chloride channel family protein